MHIDTYYHLFASIDQALTNIINFRPKHSFPQQEHRSCFSKGVYFFKQKQKTSAAACPP